MANRRRRFSLPGGKASKGGRKATLAALCLFVALVGVIVWVAWPRSQTPANRTPRSAGTAVPPAGGITPLDSTTPIVPIPVPPPVAVQVSTQALRWEGTPPATGVQVSTQLLARRQIDPATEPDRTSTPWIPRPPANILETQLALFAHGINGGSIDGVGGAQTEAALRAFQMQQGIESSGRLDRDTLRELRLESPPTIPITVTADDLSRIRPLPMTWLGKSQANSLDHESTLEWVAEQSRSHPSLIRRLNPTVDWALVRPGTELIVPSPKWPVARRAARVRVSLAGRYLRAFDERGGLLCHFPCSIGKIASKRPVGDLHVAVAVKDPNYTFDPRVFPESAEGRSLGRKLVLPPGPNNPVGVAWIGLNRPGYGIHGTPGPEQVGRTESHGCFRLANWNADYLRQMVWVGMPVSIEP